MPTDAFEEGLDLRIGLLESFAPASPYPRLRSLGREETRTFGAVRLENESLRVTILPGLGGRILSIFDKRTGTEILRPAALTPREGGRRGVRVSAGVQVLLDGDDRPNDLGPVDLQIEEPPEAVWLAESAGGTGLSFHLRVELPPERAELILEARVLNRTRRPLPYNGALALDLGEAVFDGEVGYVADRRTGLRVRSDELEHATYETLSPPGERGRGEGPFRLIRSRFSEVGTLGPRQVDVWRATLTPFSGLDGLPAVSDDVAAHFDSKRVQVQVVEALPGARVLLGLADGQTLEAPADLDPMQIMEIPLEGLSADPVALAVQDAGRADRLRTGVVVGGGLPTGGPAPEALPDPDVSAMDATELRRLTFSPAYRALAHLELGHRDLAGGGYAQADERLEAALLYNADDPLNWWTKAMARRLGGSEDEGPELPNAHYLAPLEPALRAEAFLAQSSSQGREPNPLVAPLADRPEALVEVACLLLEIGVRAEASRWIDEALRHRDVAMLRYLAAWSLLGGSRMEAEAANFVAAAGRLPFDPPYPWREIEQRALGELAMRFPEDGRLAEYLGLLNERTRSV